MDLIDKYLGEAQDFMTIARKHKFNVGDINKGLKTLRSMKRGNQKQLKKTPPNKKGLITKLKKNLERQEKLIKFHEDALEYIKNNKEEIKKQKQKQKKSKKSIF